MLTMPSPCSLYLLKATRYRKLNSVGTSNRWEFSYCNEYYIFILQSRWEHCSWFATISKIPCLFEAIIERFITWTALCRSQEYFVLCDGELHLSVYYRLRTAGVTEHRCQISNPMRFESSFQQFRWSVWEILTLDQAISILKKTKYQQI